MKTDNLIAVVNQVHFSTFYAIKHYLENNKKIGRIFLVYPKKTEYHEGGLIVADKVDRRLESVIKEYGIRFIDQVGISDVHNHKRLILEFENLLLKRLLQGQTRVIYDCSYISVHLYAFFNQYENVLFSHYRDLDLVEDEPYRLIETF